MLTAFFWLLALFMAVLTLSVRPMGAWLAPLASGQVPARLAGFDRALLRLMGVRDTAMDWREYARAVLLFSLLGALLLYVLQRVQGWLPLNPQGAAGLSLPLALNTAVSFVTNTNWQSFSPEATVGYTVQAAIEAINYYGGTVAGLSAIFATATECLGIPVTSIFDPSNLPDYASFDSRECPMCKAGQHIDALVNSFGYSAL